MSAINYSKWDKLELSDDDDIEVHPNIDKASFIRWKQADIHRKREERKLKIAQLKQELETNTELRKLIISTSDQLQQASQDSDRRAICRQLAMDVTVFDRDRKPKLLDPESEEYLQIKSIEEVFCMLLSRLFSERKLAISEESFVEHLSVILVEEVPKLDKRQDEIRTQIITEEKEQNKKITSENIFTEKFSKTMVNTEAMSKSSKEKTKTKSKEKTVEVLNPNFQEHQKQVQSSSKQDSDDTLPVRVSNSFYCARSDDVTMGRTWMMARRRS
jgi:cell division cycle protein 37